MGDGRGWDQFSFSLSLSIKTSISWHRRIDCWNAQHIHTPESLWTACDISWFWSSNLPAPPSSLLRQVTDVSNCAFESQYTTTRICSRQRPDSLVERHSHSCEYIHIQSRKVHFQKIAFPSPERRMKSSARFFLQREGWWRCFNWASYIVFLSKEPHQVGASAVSSNILLWSPKTEHLCDSQFKNRLSREMIHSIWTKVKWKPSHIDSAPFADHKIPS